MLSKSTGRKANRKSLLSDGHAYLRVQSSGTCLIGVELYLFSQKLRNQEGSVLSVIWLYPKHISNLASQIWFSEEDEEDEEEGEMVYSKRAIYLIIKHIMYNMKYYMYNIKFTRETLADMHACIHTCTVSSNIALWLLCKALSTEALSSSAVPCHL